MQTLREDTLVASETLPLGRAPKKANKSRRPGVQAAAPSPPSVPQLDIAPTNGVDYDDEEEPSEIDSFILDENDDDEDDEDDSDDDEDDDNRLNVESGDEDDDEDDDDDEDSAEPEYLLGEDDDDEDGGAAACRGDIYQVDPETQAELEALFETAGIGKLTGDTKHLTDPEVLKRLTSSVSCALDEAAAALTRMRSEPPTDGRSLVEACNEGDLTKVRKLLDEGRVSVHDTTEEGESLLSLACSAGYYELAQVLLAMRANVEDRGMKGDCTPLMEAASAGHADIVKLLIGHCADVNAQSSSGNTPLMYACAGGHESVVRLLLESGSHVEDHNENGHTPLMEAASSGHVGVAKILLEYGAGINTHSNEFKESALTLACYKGHLEMVRFLLEAGADQEHKTDEMHTALMEASVDGHVEVARLLLDSGAQVNMPADSFESPLTLAACGGHVELAMLLLERGANIEEVNDEGYTPLMEAAREGHEEMVALLLSQGADINAQTEETQGTALTLACCGGFLEVADFLIKAGADLELGASTPLMEAAQEGHLDLVKYLLENGALVNAQTGTGDTALTYACENGHTDVADLLLQYNAELEHESEGGRTPLMKASRAGHLCTVQFLISKGADVNRSTTNNDHTPLSLACAGGHLTVVELLLQHGADPYHKLKDNSTMLIEAAKGGHTPVVGLLLDYPRSIVMATPPATNLPHQQQVTLEAQEINNLASQLGGVPSVKTAATSLKSVLRKSQRPSTAGGVKPLPVEVGKVTSAAKTTLVAAPPANESAGYDFVEGSGFVIEGLEDKGLDAKSYIQSMLRRTEGSSREEQIIQKEQILAELQRVEKELQEKAQAQMMLTTANTIVQRQQQQQQVDVQTTNNDKIAMLSVQQHQQTNEALQINSTVANLDQQNCVSNPPSMAAPGPPLSLAGPPPPAQCTANQQPMSTSLTSTLASRTANLANLPPSERPKAKPSRKICFVDGAKTTVGTVTGQVGLAAAGKKMQLQAALQQHSQQLAQLQQLQQLNQQLQQQVLQQRQLKQQNQATLAALQQNAIANQQQLAALQQNVAQLQQLEQHILSQQQQQTPSNVSSPTNSSNNTANGQQHAQLQQRVQQILQQKQQLQQQIKQFQLQVEQQLAYTQHATTASPASPCSGGTPPPPPPPPPMLTDSNSNLTANKASTSRNKRSKDEANSHAYELVQASQALQAVQALNLDPGVDPQDLTADQQALLMDPSHLAAAVQNCPIPLDANCQAILNGYKDGLQVGQSLATTLQIQYPGLQCSQGGPSGLPLITDCSQGSGQSFGHPLLLQGPQFPFGQVDSNGQINFTTTDMGAGGPFLQGNEAIFLPAVSAPNPVSAGTGVGPPVVTGPDQSHHYHHHHHHHSPADSSGSAKVSGKKAKSSTKKKDADAHDLVEKRSDLFAQLDGQGNAVGPAGLPPIDGYGTSVDLDSETESNHDTALTLACAGGHEELVKLLLDRGADIEHRDKKGFTPLILAATAGHEKVVEILLDNNAEIEAQSERTKDTPLSLACSGGRYEVVESLLRRNANKEHRNVSDYTPLSLAASGGYVNIIKLLLAHGAEINSRTGSKLGISPLMLAAMNGHTSAVKLLLDMGSDINAQIETNRNTALTLACFRGRHEVVSLLLDRKANVEHRAKTGLTPLMEAASGGYVEVGRVLLDKGADVNAPPVPSSRDTALTIAADKGHYRFVELLLSRGAQVDVRNKKGNSSLWLAANGGHLEVVQLLYSAGADIDSQDNRKVSCLMAAFRKGHTKVVKWMVKHVTQFPSDQETARYIQTLSGSGDNKDVLKECHQCMEVIRVAKDRQAAEAAKNASSLLEELDREKNLEESKKAAAARKREKKKRKKLERQQKGGSLSKSDDDKNDDDKNGDDEDYEKENRMDEVDEEEEEEIINNHDSGIDANSQGSLEHPDKIHLPSGSSSSAGSSTSSSGNNNNNSTNLINNKKNKKNRTKKNGGLKEKNDNETICEDVKTPPPESRVISPLMSPPVSTATTTTATTQVQRPSVKTRINQRRSGELREDKVEMANPFEKVVSSPKKSGSIQQLRQGGNLTASGASSNVRNPAAPTGESGWKEVIRKSKKVSVPAHAISRVIGRGGCNINAIRELSGAHIEVEKQGQKAGAGQAERSISIKGSAEATRQAHTWIQAMIACPDKDIADIVGKQHLKTLQSQSNPSYPPQQQTLVINNSNAAGTVLSKTNPTAATLATIAATNLATGKPANKTPPNQPKSTGLVGTIVTKKGASNTTPATGKPSNSSIPAFTASKPPSSFAAVASGSSSTSGNFSGMMIQTGTHPGSLKNKKPAASAGVNPAKDLLSSSTPHHPISMKMKTSPQSQQEKKNEFLPFTSQSSAGISTSAEMQQGTAKIASEFSPFKTFKMSWAAGVREETDSRNFARVAASGLPPPSIPLPPSTMGVQDLDDPRATSPGLPDMSKAPGYRVGGSGRIGSPHGGSWNPATENLFPERCNSAPGTPISPVVPPIGPPPPPVPLPQQQMAKSEGGSSKPNLSPGSEPDHFHSESDPDHFGSGYCGNLSTLGRSLTPDSLGDHKEIFRRSPGGGRPGKSSVASSVTSLENSITNENLLTAAAQMVSMNNSAAGGFSDFTSTGAGGDFHFSDLMSPSPRFSIPNSSSAGPLHPSSLLSNGNNFNQSSLPPLTKPPPTSTSASSIKLNPNAPDFLRIQTPGADYMRAPPTRIPTAPPAKSFPQFSTRFNPQGPPPPPPPPPLGIHGLPNNTSTFQNILTNQGINAFLSQQQQHQPFDFSTFDANFCGRTLREITEMLSVEPSPATSFAPPPPVGPTAFLGGMEAPGKFSSRPIGSERHNLRPPLPNIPPTVAKSPWDLTGSSLYEPLVNEIAVNPGNFGFSNSLAGAAGGFDGFGKSPYNGSADFTPGGTPIKNDFSPNYHLGSGGKKVSNSYLDLPGASNNRPDPNSVRRNMNQLWGKSWGTDEI